MYTRDRNELCEPPCRRARPTGDVVVSAGRAGARCTPRAIRRAGTARSRSAGRGGEEEEAHGDACDQRERQEQSAQPPPPPPSSDGPANNLDAGGRRRRQKTGGGGGGGGGSGGGLLDEGLRHASRLGHQPGGVRPGLPAAEGRLHGAGVGVGFGFGFGFRLGLGVRMRVRVRVRVRGRGGLGRGKAACMAAALCFRLLPSAVRRAATSRGTPGMASSCCGSPTCTSRSRSSSDAPGSPAAAPPEG